MKAIVQAVVITAVSGVAALAHWKIAPPGPAAEVVCDPATLQEGEICLKTVLEEWVPDGGVLWIDARTEAEWKADGLPGSVRLAPGQDFDRLLGEAGKQLLDSKRAVIYCGNAGCGLSRQVASLLRSESYLIVPGLLQDAKALHGGHAALKAAGMVTGPSSGL